MSTAPADALHRLDDHGRRVVVDDGAELVDRRVGLMNLTSNGARGKPYHFCCAPQVTAPAAAVRP